jgi:hypothetical protein
MVGRLTDFFSASPDLEHFEDFATLLQPYPYEAGVAVFFGLRLRLALQHHPHIGACRLR